MEDARVSFPNDSFKHISHCLAIRFPHVQTVVGQLTSPAELRVSNLETSVDALTSSSGMYHRLFDGHYIVVLHRGDPDSWMGQQHRRIQIVFVRLTRRPPLWKYLLASDFLIQTILAAWQQENTVYSEICPCPQSVLPPWRLESVWD